MKLKPRIIDGAEADLGILKGGPAGGGSKQGFGPLGSSPVVCEGMGQNSEWQPPLFETGNIRRAGTNSGRIHQT